MNNLEILNAGSISNVVSGGAGRSSLQSAERYEGRS